MADLRISQLAANTGLAASTVFEVEKDPSGSAASEKVTDDEMMQRYNAQAIGIVCSDESTALTTGIGIVTFRMPYAFTVSGVRASLTTASNSGTVDVDINQGGVSILSTIITIDQDEKTSTTAVTPPVVSDTTLDDDEEMTIDLDSAGTGASGLKVWILGYPTP